MMRTALIYDFDGTLASGNVQEHSFIPDMGLSTKEFWGEVKRLARDHDADEILTYMWHLLETARGRGISVTREMLRQHGKDTPLFSGVDSWFDRVNEYGRARGLDMEHYIISSGTLEMIEGSRIARRFREIYASKFIYDAEGVAVWPGVAIDYTSKTQFLFRINKGISNTWDSAAINRWIPLQERPVPFERMIFIGDGDTDIPAMKMVRHQGGHSIAVFDPEKWKEAASQDKIHRLIAEDRVHFVAPADYSEGSQLSVIVKGLLGRIARDDSYRPPPRDGSPADSPTDTGNAFPTPPADGASNIAETQLQEVLAYCSEDGRICPMPSAWNELWEMLPNKRETSDGWEPPLPLILGAWESPDIWKVILLREHIEFAARHGALERVNDYICGLTEGQWEYSRCF